MEYENLSKRSADPKEAGGSQQAEEDKYHGRQPRRGRGGVRSLTVAVVAPTLAGLLVAGTAFRSDWYAKPSWAPPMWAFVPVWIVGLPIMGLASWLVWANGGWSKQARPLGFFLAQLACFLAWPALGSRCSALALADSALLVALMIACVLQFKRCNSAAANLMQICLALGVVAIAHSASAWYSSPNSA